MKTYAIAFAVSMIVGFVIIVNLVKSTADVQPRDIAAEIAAAQK